MISKVDDNFIIKETGEIIEPKYLDYTYEDYVKDNVKWVVLMTAKEETREVELDKMLNSTDYLVEHKLDGTRATLHLMDGGNRIFSRRESVKTKWFCENTNSLPHLQESVKALNGTVLDGELLIPDKPFKEVSSIMNCSWEKAIDRQLEVGLVVLNAFDIVWYKNVYVARLPLWRRKELLEQVVEELGNEYAQVLECFDDLVPVTMNNKTLSIEKQVKDTEKFKRTYPTLYKTMCKYGIANFNSYRWTEVDLSKKAYYEFIIANGGEGIILKDKEGKYYHKKGREYTKVKKFLTKDVVILAFEDPTEEYKGNNGKKPTPKEWRYWIHQELDMFDTSDPSELYMVEKYPDEYAPISKYFYEQWVGTIKFGVVITPEEKAKLLKSKKAKEFKFHMIDDLEYLEVGECSGFDEEQRKIFSDDKEYWIGTTIEILANEIFMDTGRLRHPRFHRIREDKCPTTCTWKDHIEDY